MPLGFDLSKYKTDEFIETGTLHGAGCIKAVRAGFKRIQSIEILEENFELSKDRLHKYLSSDEVDIKLHLADSAEVLPEILSDINWRCTFWLDGHGTAEHIRVLIKDGAEMVKPPGKGNCPLMEELDAIANHHIRDHIIMIDDLRTIKGGSWGVDGVTEEAVMKKLTEINPLYDIAYEDNNLAGHRNNIYSVFKNDCLIAFC